MAASTTPFIPPNFEVPATLQTAEFKLRMLSVDDVVKDYDAVMTSVDHLKTIWPSGSWPDGLTLRQNLVDLGWHEKEFQIRQSFAYTVLSPSEDRVLGCVYIYPSRKVGHDASVYLWARQSELASGLKTACSPPSRAGFRLRGRSRRWSSLAARWPGTTGGRSQTGFVEELAQNRCLAAIGELLWLEQAVAKYAAVIQHKCAMLDWRPVGGRMPFRPDGVIGGTP